MSSNSSVGLMCFRDGGLAAAIAHHSHRGGDIQSLAAMTAAFVGGGVKVWRLAGEMAE